MKETTQKVADSVATENKTEVVSVREYKFLKMVTIKKTDKDNHYHFYNNVYINGILVNAFDKRKQSDLFIFVKTFIDINTKD